MKYEVMDPNEESNREHYELLKELIGQHHSSIVEAKIVLAWQFKVKPDADGVLELGKCRLASELDRGLHGYDFVITINHDAWKLMQPAQRRALLDHELCHASAKESESGEVTYRIRKHDLEEFTEIVRRHGIWRTAVDQMIAAGLEHLKQGDLFERLRPELKQVAKEFDERHGTMSIVVTPEITARLEKIAPRIRNRRARA